MRIELVGGMGIGKTTLCNVLSDIGYHCILEDLGENPFLAKMYKDEEGFRFPSQMWFILSKYVELQAELKSNEINVIDQAILNIKAYTNLLFNRMSSQPPAFAEDKLQLGSQEKLQEIPDQVRDDKEWALIQGLFDYIDDKFGKPDLLVYLKASPEIQMKRIHARNRDYELDVDVKYLGDLKAEIDTLVAAEAKAGQQIITIDTDNIFLAQHHLFATQLADDIASRLNFCITPIINKKPVIASDQRERGNPEPQTPILDCFVGKTSSQ